MTYVHMLISLAKQLCLQYKRSSKFEVEIIQVLRAWLHPNQVNYHWMPRGCLCFQLHFNLRFPHRSLQGYESEFKTKHYKITLCVTVILTRFYKCVVFHMQSGAAVVCRAQWGIGCGVCRAADNIIAWDTVSRMLIYHIIITGLPNSGKLMRFVRDTPVDRCQFGFLFLNLIALL